MINSAWKHCLLLLLPLFLSGCVHYDLGIHFHGLHRGEIVQQIELGQQLTNFSQADVEDWLGSLQQRSRELGGKTQRLSPQAVELTIPFANAEQLERKFNRFFNPSQRLATQPPSELVRLDSQLNAEQTNFLLLQRTHLQINIDLTALGTIQGENSKLVGTSSLIDLKFRFQTPWGSEIITSEEKENDSLVKQNGTETIWYLQPGKNNQIEIAFWLPEPLGWGAIAIIIVVYIGLVLKDRSAAVSSTPSSN